MYGVCCILVFVLVVATLHRNLPNMKFKRGICQPIPLCCVWVIDKKTKSDLQLMFSSSVLSILVSIILPLSS